MRVENYGLGFYSNSGSEWIPFWKEDDAYGKTWWFVVGG